MAISKDGRVSTPPSLTRSIPELSEFLTRNSANYVMAIEGNDLHIQVAKAYCIYSWIANNISYDRQLWQAYQFGDENSFEHSTQAENVLDRCMTVSKGYANLFYSLASKSGLMVEVIHGNIKGWKSQSPTRSKTVFKPSRENAHTWNLVSTSILLAELRIFTALLIGVTCRSHLEVLFISLTAPWLVATSHQTQSINRISLTTSLLCLHKN